MGIVMDMSSYEIERSNAPEAGYDDEVLYSGWNPTVALACQHAVTHERNMIMPSSLASVDAETFLEKMYAYQR